MLLAVAVVLTGLMGVGLVRLGGGAVARAQAHAAADAAALAGAADGRAAAQAVAAANHATLERFEVIGSDVVVTVRVASERAEARSRAGLIPPPSPTGPR